MTKPFALGVGRHRRIIAWSSGLVVLTGYRLDLWRFPVNTPLGARFVPRRHFQRIVRRLFR